MTGRVLIVDDHALVAAGLRVALAGRGWTVDTTPLLTAGEIIAHARRFQPDCVLLDIRLGPALSGIDLIAPLRRGGAEVVMLTAETEPTVLACALEAGAAGWIGKHTTLDQVEATLGDLAASVPLIGRGVRESMLDELRSQRSNRRHALAPFAQLTVRERDVLAGLVEGLSAEEIAARRYVALTTVRSHIRGVLNKLGARSQLAAVAHATRAGWTPTIQPAAA